MKKLIGFLTLVGFLVASNMQFIHAMEMNDKPMYNGHIMQKSDNAIFCDTSNNNENKACYKDLIGDKYITSIKINTELNKLFVNVLPIVFQYKIQPINIETNINSHAPPIIIFQKSSYTNLLGIVKSLN